MSIQDTATIARCGRSDCTHPATTRTIMHTESGRSRQMLGCDDHVDHHREVASEFGFIVTKVERIVSVVSPLPFAPYTDQGLSLAIETAAMQVTWAVNAHRAMEPVVIAQAQLVLDLCRARRRRIVSALNLWLAETGAAMGARS